MPSARVTNPGPPHLPTPGPGSSARTNTAWGTPSSRVTKLRHQCMPYVKYTYAWPGAPNITSVRGVRRPPREWAARSLGPRYASTSISRPNRRVPSISRTRTLPSRSRATVTVSRSKNSGPRTTGSLGVRCANLLSLRMTAALVDVERLVRDLVHRLPVHARPPGHDSDAELHRHRSLVVPVQLLEGGADAGADLVGVAFVSVRHRDPELVAAQPAASVGGAHRPLQLVRQYANGLVADVMAVRVVDLLRLSRSIIIKARRRLCRSDAATALSMARSNSGRLASPVR